LHRRTHCGASRREDSLRSWDLLAFGSLVGLVALPLVGAAAVLVAAKNASGEYERGPNAPRPYERAEGESYERSESYWARLQVAGAAKAATPTRSAKPTRA
jgi:hypothetical protein